MDNRRRHFLQSLLAAPLVGAGCAHSPSKTGKAQGENPVLPAYVPSPGSPRRVIHLVADGMGSGILACANHHSQIHRGRRLTWFELLRRPDLQVGTMDVRSQNSLVTDSSASASAWGSGVRIPNGNVNQDSRGRPLLTLYELLGEAGWKRGLVTTTEITHATPSGFIASVKNRDDAEGIAVQYLDRKVDVALGGGRKFFLSKERKDKRDLLADFRKAGFAVLQSPTDLASAPGDGRWLGVFSSSHIPYVVDQKGGLTRPDPAPSLAEMTRAALRQLAASERFILQVEGGRVDHGCHNNDAAAAILEMIGFDEALDVCLEFQKEHPETLLVMTSDHSTGNPGLNGMGDHYGQSPMLFRNISGMRQSFGEILNRLKLAEKTSDRLAILKESTGYTPSSRRVDALTPFVQKKGYSLFDGLNSDLGALGQVLANHLGVSFTSTAHTSDHVPIHALGPQAERFRGFVENTQVFDHYMDFAGIRFRNPQEKLITGVEVTPRVTRTHWV
jgi:alkaline phosphatase